MCFYATILKDGDKNSAYYRGKPTTTPDGSDDEVTCYAETGLMHVLIVWPEYFSE